MKGKFLKAVSAALMSAALMTTAVVTPLNVSANYQLLGETTFECKMIPWHAVEAAPAKQIFRIEDGTAHIKIYCPKGAEGECWDLQLRHRGLSFRAGHEYEVSFQVKSNREGIELESHISDSKDDKRYFVVDGGEMHNGPDMDGNWGKPYILTTKYQTVTGTFTPTEDIDAAQWTFQYAKGDKYAGNAQEGDEIWFDMMSIVDKSGNDVTSEYDNFGYTSRDYSGVENNYISVNQLGYYTKLEKEATLGDNSGDIIYGTSKIDIGSSPLRFDLIDTETGESVYNGKTMPFGRDKDSGDHVHKIDFTEYNKSGRYYLKVGDWRSMEFNIGDDIYDKNMLTNALNFFYQNRADSDIESEYISSGDKKSLAHSGIDNAEKAFVQNVRIGSYKNADEPKDTYGSSEIDCSGGWYDADDNANHGKSIVKGSNTLWTLMNMYERAAQTEEGKSKFADKSGAVLSPDGGNGIPDILDECIYELEFMKKMVVQPDEPTYGKKYAGMVYHRVKDYKWTELGTKPWDYIKEYEMTRVIEPPTFAATLELSACAAQAARLLKPYAPEKAEEYLELAKTSFEAYQKNYYVYSDKDYKAPNSLYAPEYIEPDADSDVTDEAYHAACELFATTGDTAYYDLIKEYKDAFKFIAMFKGTSYSAYSEPCYNKTAFDLTNTAAEGSLTLLLNKDKLDAKDVSRLNTTLLSAADEFLRTESSQGYGIPFYTETGYSVSSLTPDIVIRGYEPGSNTKVVNNAMIMAYAFDITKDRKYIDGTATAMDYLLGRNPMSFSFITGYGEYAVKNPFHTFWANEVDPTFPKAPDGVLSSGPSAYLMDGYVRALGFVPGSEDNPSQRCYADSVESWCTNSTGIDQNAPLAWVLSFMQDEASGYEQQTVVYPTAEPTSEPAAPPTTEYREYQYVMRGDIDLNDIIDLADVTMLAKHLIGAAQLLPDPADDEIRYMRLKYNPDVNRDGVVDILDLSLLIEYNLGKKEIVPSKGVS